MLISIDILKYSLDSLILRGCLTASEGLRPCPVPEEQLVAGRYDEYLVSRVEGDRRDD